MKLPLEKLVKLFTVREKWQLALIFFVTTVNGLVQALGVLSVMPFIAVLTDPSIISSLL